MELPPPTPPALTSVDPPFEWSDLFDFALDDQLFAGLEIDPSPPPPPPPPPPTSEEHAETGDRVRKRDPRMVCENFLAGMVPCACPEMDAKMEEEQEEEEVARGKKRVRVRVGRTPGVARCQVPGCEVDITELKGYHRRHRVCLVCANSVSVLIDAELKRYCQQCGKFHLLPDFDEGKRSCRRKLERHNNRRRRKPADSRASVQKDLQRDLQTDDNSSDSEACKENAWSTSQIADDSKDGTLSNLRPAPESQNIDIESTMTFTQVDRVLENSQKDHSPPSDKSAYSSTCPTGRISFKLYDWNPAEFPRRLRHQIFQWLANMPVELEGYVRPGCTILTAFVSMPQFMWVKLFEDPASYIQNSIGPGGMISGKGAVLVYLNDTIFRILGDGASVMKVKVALRAPKLHYVYPPCFEAGKPMDLIACGSNLLQPKFRHVQKIKVAKMRMLRWMCGHTINGRLRNEVFGRKLVVASIEDTVRENRLNWFGHVRRRAPLRIERSLISFGGKYLAHDYYVAFPRGKNNKESGADFDSQFCRIYVPRTEPSFFGPAFIEVENECGLSNFLPVLIGDQHVCAEIKMIHQKYDFCHCGMKSHVRSWGSSHGNCEVSCSRESAFSEFMVDVAWLLKWPCSEKLQGTMTSCQIQRFKCLLNFLISNKCTFILERILQSLQFVSDEIESGDVHTITDFDRRLLKEHFNHAKDFLCQTACNDELFLQYVRDPMRKGDDRLESSVDNDILSDDFTTSHKMLHELESSCILEMRGPETKSRFSVSSDGPRKGETSALLDQDAGLNVKGSREWARTSSYHMSANKLTISRPLIYLIAALAVCCGVCAVVFHPHKVATFAVTIRRCVLEKSSNKHA
ncbi:hypothetical protein KSS87_022152 [Heliosperma pusillum]|nr:hypothetical protein KSS87_022152 [Heliosperma pusillum]